MKLIHYQNDFIFIHESSFNEIKEILSSRERKTLKNIKTVVVDDETYYDLHTLCGVFYRDILIDINKAKTDRDNYTEIIQHYKNLLSENEIEKTTTCDIFVSDFFSFYLSSIESTRVRFEIDILTTTKNNYEKFYDKFIERLQSIEIDENEILSTIKKRNYLSKR